MPGNPPLPKKEVALALLERESIFVHLDPRAIGVVVPAWFKRQPQLVLHVGLNMPNPIPDLRVDDDSMSCTLSFNRSPFFCIVPWTSVYAIIGELDGHGMLWHDDVPPEVSMQMRAREEAAAKKPAERPLSVVPSAAPEKPRAIGKTAAKRSAPRESAEAAKAKKPRAKKTPALAEVPSANARGSKGGASRAKEGVLIPIPARSKKSSKGAAEPAPTASPTTRANTRRERPAPSPVLVTEPAAKKPAQPAPQPAPQPAHRPAAPQVLPSSSSPQGDEAENQRPNPARRPAPGKPTPGKGAPGKPKREIPPYLRVVK